MAASIDDVIKKAVTLGNQSDFVGASREWKRVLSMCDGSESKHYVEALCGMARGSAAVGDFHSALQQYTNAVDTLSADCDTDTRVTILNNIAAMRSRIGENDRAVEIWSEALEVLQGLNDKKGIAVTMNNIATALSVMGNHEKALKEYERARDIFNEINDKQSSVMTSNNIATMHSAMGNVGKAEEEYLSALNGKIQLFGENHRSTATTRHNLGDVLRRKGDFDTAMSHLNTSLTIREKLLGTSHAETLQTRSSLAELYSNTGDTEAALQELQLILKTRESSLGKEHPDTTRTIVTIGLLTNDVSLLQKAVLDFTVTLGASHIETIRAKTEHAGLLLASDDVRDMDEGKAILLSLLHGSDGDNPVSLSRAAIAEKLAEHTDGDESSTYYNTAYQMVFEILGADHSETSRLRVLAHSPTESTPFSFSKIERGLKSSPATLGGDQSVGISNEDLLDLLRTHGVTDSGREVLIDEGVDATVLDQLTFDCLIEMGISDSDAEAITRAAALLKCNSESGGLSDSLTKGF
eukprot:TRINITY_DN568_c1_g2_i1.p1 TRINITY_DN568_c1_g2~~TRINITY_DN568_c1_g2_i1.p1  ORF type:complete len:524 (+),score=139.65 TRINITY_DN568_c1_g2_i1:41-1612(+)